MSLSFGVVYIVRFDNMRSMSRVSRWAKVCSTLPSLTQLPLISVNRKHKIQKQPYSGTGTFGSWNLAYLVRPRLITIILARHHAGAPRLICGARPAYPHHVPGHLVCVFRFGLVIRTLRNYAEVCCKERVVQRFADMTVELEIRRDRDEVRATGSIRTLLRLLEMAPGGNR